MWQRTGDKSASTLTKIGNFFQSPASLMAFISLTSGDVAAFKLLFALAAIYALLTYLAYSAIHINFVSPLGADAPLDRFSEARAIDHVRVLSEEIGGRQVSHAAVSNLLSFRWIGLFTFPNPHSHNFEPVCLSIGRKYSLVH